MRRIIQAVLCTTVFGSAAFAQNVGPSTTTSPYLLPTVAGVSTTSILTVGDSIGGYKMVGIPDGLGAFSSASTGDFTLLMNHELGANVGVTRAHGSTGAFVSRWTINPSNLTVTSGRDHNQAASDINTWNTTSSAYVNGTTAYARLCSADLPAASAFKFGSLGTDSRIFMNGEETGAEGRAFAHIVTGSATNQSWQLPRLGKFSWENSIASPFAQEKTVVVGTDDATPGQVYIYVGNKTATGNDIERAGLTNGNLFGVKVTGLPVETGASAASGRFSLFNKGNVSNSTGAQVQANSVANGVTEFLRPEDGQFDPRPGKENDFYFVTTDGYNAPGTSARHSRLYRMRFDDITNPEAGGSVAMLLDGAVDGVNMMDNMTIDSRGRIIIQEDIGGQDPLSKVWVYDIDSANRGVIATHTPALFTPGAAAFLTRDEEASGVIDAKDILGDGWFLLDVQAHYANGAELVEGGQLLAMYVDPSIVPEPTSLAALGMAALAFVRRTRK